MVPSSCTPLSISEPSDEETTDFACDLPSSYFRFTYNYEHSEKGMEDLTNWLSMVLTIAFKRVCFRDQEIIINNGAIIEEAIDGILIEYPIRGLRTIGGLFGHYMITAVSPLHEGGRGVGEDVVHMVVEDVVDDWSNNQGSSQERSSERIPAIKVRSLINSVGQAENILHCNHVNKLHDIVKEITGRPPSRVLKKLKGRTRFGKQPDMSYIPGYLSTLRQMQGLDPFPTYLGEVHYTDSATKGMLDCALQIDGSDFQSEYVQGVDIKVDKRNNELREVHISAYDCTLEEMLRISLNDDLDNELRAAVLQTALIKARRAHVDIQCLIDLFISPPQTVEQVQNLANQFRDRARGHWRDALGSFTYKPFEATERFRRSILRLIEDYSVIPTLRDDLNANRSYYEEQIVGIEGRIAECGNMEVDRASLTTKAILANRVTFVLCESGNGISVEKFLAGRRVDDTQWHIPIQAFMGIVSAHARTGARITLNRLHLEPAYKRMERIPSIPSEIGPLRIRQEMIIPDLLSEFARQQFSGRQATTAPDRLRREFENRGKITVDKIDLKYLSDDALVTISGEDTIGLQVDVSTARSELAHSICHPTKSPHTKKISKVI